MVLTAAERRGALVIVLLLAIGAGWDLWRPARPVGKATEPPAALEAAARSTAPGGARDSPARPPLERRVDLNRADVAELDRLPGIGPVLAGRIVEHRARHGPFRRVEELRAVRGVGPRLLERLRPRVMVSGTADSAR
jgi:competence protein ComEA